VRKAVVLAAGKGTRMGALTHQLPKPMLRLAGKPIIEHILDRLREAGTKEALIVTGYRAEMIEQHLGEYPMKLMFERQQTINGTGTAALLARNFAGEHPFLLTFGDIICESSDYRYLSALGGAAVLGVKHVDDPYRGAAVYEENGMVTRIIEKPPQGTSTTHWNSAGLYTFRPVIFEHVAKLDPSPRGEYELSDAIASLIAGGERVLLYSMKGAWRDVGRPEDLRPAEQLLKS
jgi:dTDP-glucose pyrophosphorylase